MASRRGKIFILIIFLLNAAAFLIVPWENFFLDREKVIFGFSHHLEEIDVKYLEATDVYVPMTFGTDVVKGYEHPTWFHRKLMPYARFYLYTGPVTDKMRTEIKHKKTENDGIPVLISELIVIPGSGKVKIDMDASYANDYYVKEGMKKLSKEYPLPGDGCYDSATPFCQAHADFKNTAARNLIIAVAAEVVLITVILVIAAASSKSKKKQDPANTAK